MKQLSGLDAGFLAMESDRVYGHVGSLCVLDPSTAPQPLTLARLTEHVASRAHLLPLLHRRLLTVPLGLDQPYWIEDAETDFAYHVREVALPPPGDDHQLCLQVARLHARPLDREQPLWELYLITGLAGGRVGIYTKIHHAAMDGVSGDDVLAAVLDPTPQGRDLAPADARSLEQAPSALALLARSAVSAAFQPVRVVHLGLDVLRSSVGLGTVAVQRLPLLDRLVGRADGVPRQALRAPATPFNAPVSAHRRWAFADLPLDDVKRVKRAAGVTVNDVVMALTAGALRRWLLAHDALPHDPLIAAVPISLRPPTSPAHRESGAEPALGNHLSAMLPELPTDVATAQGRLLATKAAMAVAKSQSSALPPTLLGEAADLAVPVVVEPAWWLAAHLRLMEVVNPFNLFVSNVPGPRTTVYYAGAELLAYFPISAIAQGQGLNVTVMSYRDRLCFGLLACRLLVPDLEDLAAGFALELEALVAAVEQAS